MNKNLEAGLNIRVRKRVRLFAAALASLLILFGTKNNALAAGESAVLSGGGSVAEGEIINVSLTANCSDSVWGYEAVLSYDSSVIQFLSTSGGTVNGGNGQISITGTATQAGSQTVTLAFKAIDTGSSAVSLIQCLVSNGDSEVNCAGSAVSVSVANQAPAPTPTPGGDDASGDATLSSLTVSPGSLSPEFNPWTLWYELEVEEGTESIVVSAKTTDPSSEVIAVNGSKSIEHGENVVTVVTESSGGARLTYTIMVYCGVHADGTEMDSIEDKAKETNVTVGGSQYIISDKIPQDKIPEGFKKALASYNGQNILTVNNSKLGISMVLLKNGEDDSSSFYIFDEQTGNVYPYYKIGLSDKRFIVLLQPESDAVVGDGLKLMATEVLGKRFYCCMGDEEKIYYFYSVDQEGNRGWYRYDDLDKTYQRYDMDAKVKAGKEFSNLKTELKNSQDMQRIFMIVAIAAGALFIIVLIIAIVLFAKRRAGAALYDDYEDDEDDEDDDEVEDDREDENEDDDEPTEALVVDFIEDEGAAHEETQDNKQEQSEETEQACGEDKENTAGAFKEEAEDNRQTSEEDKAEKESPEEIIEGFVAIDLSAVEEVIKEEVAETRKAETPDDQPATKAEPDDDYNRADVELDDDYNRADVELDDDYNRADVELDDDYNMAETESDDDYKTAEVDLDDDYARVSTRNMDKNTENVKVEFEFIDFDD